jgi:hypothetical protein
MKAEMQAHPGLEVKSSYPQIQKVRDPFPLNYMSSDSATLSPATDSYALTLSHSTRHCLRARRTRMRSPSPEYPFTWHHRSAGPMRYRVMAVGLSL